MYLPMLNDEQLIYAARYQDQVVQTALEVELAARLDEANARIDELDAENDELRGEYRTIDEFKRDTLAPILAQCDELARALREAVES
jgi:cell division protein FtsB